MLCSLQGGSMVSEVSCWSEAKSPCSKAAGALAAACRQGRQIQGSGGRVGSQETGSYRLRRRGSRPPVATVVTRQTAQVLSDLTAAAEQGAD